MDKPNSENMSYLNESADPSESRTIVKLVDAVRSANQTAATGIARDLIMEGANPAYVCSILMRMARTCLNGVRGGSPVPIENHLPEAVAKLGPDDIRPLFAAAESASAASALEDYLWGHAENLLNDHDEASKATCLASIGLAIGATDKNLGLALTKIRQKSNQFRFVHVEGDHIPARVAAEQDFYEAKFLSYLKIFCEPNSLVIDVGANIGNHAIYFASQGNVSVLAVEPEPINYSCLIINKFLNGHAKDVICKNVAVGAHTGFINLMMTADNNRGSFTACKEEPVASSSANAKEHFHADMTTLDKLVPAALRRRVSLIKVDVEGMESDVLSGAKQLIRSSRPVIAAECATPDDYRSVDHVLRDFGYTAIEVFNATPTFVFVCRENATTSRTIIDRLHASTVVKAFGMKSFVAPK